MTGRVVLAVLLCAWPFASAAADSPPAFAERAFIDHQNLRYLYRLAEGDRVDEQRLELEVARMKRNMDEAVRYGMTSYVIFSRSFEWLVDYDRLWLDRAGRASVVVEPPLFPAQHPRRAVVRRFGEALREVLEHAESLGLRVVFHTNQFEFPEEVYARWGDLMSGSARVCPGRGFTWVVFRGKVGEFFDRYPECDGLQLTMSETEVSPLECRCPRCEGMSTAERLARVAQETWAVCAARGKELQVRTWGTVGSEEYDEVDALLPPEAVVSTKNTYGDFNIASGPKPYVGRGKRRQVVEFDCWREYTGWNYFPCYMGDIYAERMRAAAASGVWGVAARLNWGEGERLIFDVPWGNEVNVYLFARLAQDPWQDPDALLREWIAGRFPEEARDVAFEFYKLTPRVQTIWMTHLGRNCNDHSRLYKSADGSYYRRLEGQLGGLAEEGFSFTKEEVDARRRAVDEAYARVEEVLSRLCPLIPAEWAGDLSRCARGEWFVARSVCDCMEIFGLMRRVLAGEPLPPLDDLRAAVEERLREWRGLYPEHYEAMRAGNLPEILAELERMGGGWRPPGVGAL